MRGARDTPEHSARLARAGPSSHGRDGGDVTAASDLPRAPASSLPSAASAQRSGGGSAEAPCRHRPGRPPFAARDSRALPSAHTATSDSPQPGSRERRPPRAPRWRGEAAGCPASGPLRQEAAPSLSRGRRHQLPWASLSLLAAAVTCGGGVMPPALGAPLLSEPEPCGVLPCWLALPVALAHPFLLMHKKRVPRYTFITYEERVLCTLQR